MDRIVADGGQGGAFASISEAINAAVSGDRIIIYPKTNGGSYSENLTISSKSLQLLSATEGEMWKLHGTITFTAGVAGQELVIHQANLLNGSIQTSAAAPTGTRSRVVVTGCQLDNGNISFNFNNWDLNIAGNTLLQGGIYFRFGKVVGNTVIVAACAHGIVCSAGESGSDDFVYIVGNRVIMDTASGCWPYDWTGIYYNSNSHFAYVTNNFIHVRSLYQIALRLESSKTSSVKANKIENNSILQEGGAYNSTFRVVAHGSPTDLYNNSIVATVSAYGFYSDQMSINDRWGYNYTNIAAGSNAYINVLNDGTNLFNQSITMNSTTGDVTAGAPVNGGSPDNAYLDLDLTRNDADCFGGSYSRANFTQNPTGAVTTFLIAPRRVLSGGTISITAEGYDR